MLQWLRDRGCSRDHSPPANQHQTSAEQMVVKRKRPSDADTKPASKPKPGSSNAKHDKTGPDKAKFRKGSATGASSRPGYKTDPASAKHQSVKRQKTTTSKFQHGPSNSKGASSKPSFAAKPRPQADSRGKAQMVAKAPRGQDHYQVRQLSVQQQAATLGFSAAACSLQLCLTLVAVSRV